MIEWRDEGALLSLRPHGESSVIIDVLTAEHGRVSGVVRGGASRKQAPLLQPGTQLDLTWRARLEDHLGSFNAEPLRSRAALVMDSRFALAGMNTTLGLLSFCLPEREPMPGFYTRSLQVLDLLGQDVVWPLAYLQWEEALLAETGYGLDLSACAVTGATEDLVYVSPKSGRAVSRQGAGEWADRLLALPPVMLGKTATDAGIRAGLDLTGYFLREKLATDLGTRPLPDARARFLAAYDRFISAQEPDQ
jgi:DNA repair protein RecO (recombination protein O)